MALIVKPDVSKVWAESGSKSAPPDAKIATGWNYEMMPFEWENFLQNRTDKTLGHISQRGIAEWDEFTEYQSARSYVTGSNGIVYRAVTTNIGNDPTADNGTNWIRAFPITSIAGVTTFHAGAVGNSEAMRITATGLVGLGTTTPAYKLDINVAAANNALRLFSNAGVDVVTTYRRGAVDVGNVNGVFDGLYVKGSQVIRFDTAGTERARFDTNGRLLFNGNATISVQNGADSMYLGGGSTNPTEVNFQASNIVRAWTNGVERYRVTSAGHVGIGSVAPNYSNYGVNSRVLSIKGSGSHGAIEIATDASPANNLSLGELSFVNTGATTAKQSTAIVSFQDGVNSATPGGRLGFYTRIDGGAITEKMRVTASGFVGIGTVTPGAKLDVSGDIHLSASAKSRVTFNRASEYANWIEADGTSSSNSIRFGVGNAEQLRITNTGLLGLGTTTPTTKLHTYQASGTNTLTIDNGSTSAANFSQTTFKTGTASWTQGTEAGDTGRFYIYNNAATADQFRLSGGANSGVELIALGTGGLTLSTNGVQRVRYNNLGQKLEFLPTSELALTTDSQMTQTLTSNTALKLSVRGNDGTTRAATVPLDSSNPTLVTADDLAAAIASVSATAPTGSIQAMARLTAPTGWLLVDGKTIGSAASGATARANADTAALFAELWNFSAAAVPIYSNTGAVSTRGVSAAADFTANKRIALFTPDGGYFLRMWTPTQTLDGGRAAGTTQGPDIQNHAHNLLCDNSGSGPNGQVASINGGDYGMGGTARSNGYLFTNGVGEQLISSVGGSETRPYNLAMPHYIKL